jgi:hypothetical protein
LAVRPQAWYVPTVNAVNVRPPASVIGVKVLTWMPCMKLPAFCPQQDAAPLLESPHAVLHPALIVVGVNTVGAITITVAAAYLPSTVVEMVAEPRPTAVITAESEKRPLS